MASTDITEAGSYHRDGDAYVCDLCPHGCRIEKGRYGLCGSRFGGDDSLIACSYGKVSSLCIDPIEKKPLYNYHPGSEILSVGGFGCNMRCRHCQNHSISQTSEKGKEFVAPEILAEICRREGMDSVAFTYNEPTIWSEYILDVMRYDPGLRCVLVTNGLINEAPLRELCKVTDAMNIDVKGFTDGFYTKICGARLKDVMRTVEIAFEEGVHTEITYLLIPGYNDSEDELKGFSSWIEGISPDIPVHFTRFHPDHLMRDVPCTPESTMIKARMIAKDSGLKNVYLGNISVEGCSDTYCPECGKVLIRRTGYRTEIEGLNGSRCAFCGSDLYLRN